MTELDAWARAGSVFDYGGHRIFWRADGDNDAPALLLIHGLPTASWDWHALWEPLATRFRLLTLDMIGFGLSAKPRPYDYRIADQADLFDAFLDARGVDRCHVLAHDYGDTVAQELLARDQRRQDPRLQSVCFLNGGLFPETHRPVPIQRLLMSPLGPLVARLTRRPRFDATFRRIFGTATAPDRRHLDAFWELATRDGGAKVIPHLMRYMKERRRHRERWVGALRTAAVPLKLIDGAADPVSGEHMARRYRELVPAADVTLLDDIGHYPQVEAPQQVADAYIDFWDRHFGSSS